MYLQFLKKYPIFFRYFIGDFFGKVADQYFIILFPFLILAINNDTTALALVLSMNAIGRIIMLPFGGIMADRYKPQQFLFGNNILQFMGMWLFLYLFQSEQLSILFLAFMALFYGLADGISLPASLSIVPKLIKKEDLLKANSLTQGLEQVTGILGPVLAGLLIANFGIQMGLVGALVLYLVSATSYFSILSLPTETPQPTKLHWWNDFKQGYQNVKENPVVLTTLIFSATSNIFIMGTVTIGFILLLRQKFGLGADYYSYTGLFFSIGFLIGFPFVARLKKIAYPGRMVILFYFFYFLVFIGFAWAPNVWILLALLVPTGIVVAFDATIGNTWVQSTTPVQVIGRVASFQVFAFIAVDPIGQTLAGFLAKFGVEVIFYVAAFGSLAVALINFVLNPVLRKRYDLDFTQESIAEASE